MIEVMLSDPVVHVNGWTADMDQLGAYELKVRKDPDRLKAERDKARAFGRDPTRVRQMEKIPCTVLTTRPDKPGEAWFLPGLWPRVKAYLDEHRLQYEIDDRRDPAIRPAPDYSRLAGTELRPGQPEMLVKLVNGDCGIIAASVGQGKSYIIAKLCKIYPTLNIVVTSNMLTVVNQLHKDIAEELAPEPVGIVTGVTDKSQGCRVIVASLGSLNKIPETKVQLLLVDECHCLGTPSFSKVVAKFRFARRFGFSATPIRNDGSELVMESLVGPVVYKSTYGEGVANGNVTPVKYTMLSCPKCPKFALTKGLSDATVQRFAYYRNRYRNQLLSEVVWKVRRVFSGQILIVTQTVEHAIALHQLLPWFVVTHSDNYDPDEMRSKMGKEYPSVDFNKYVTSKKQNEIAIAAFAKGSLKWLISTKLIKQGVNFPHLRCLIRADATASEIDCFQLPGRLSRLDEGKEWAYLIDFDDTFLPLAAFKTKKRREKYDEYGWKPITLEEVLDGLKREDRPGDPGFGPAPAAGPELRLPGATT